MSGRSDQTGGAGSDAVEGASLRKHDTMSRWWSRKYYGARLPLTMDVYDIAKRHRIAVRLASGLGGLGRAIEVGCGTGDNIAAIAADERWGIDVSPGMIDQAARLHPGISFQVQDLRDFTPGQPFDLVLCLGVVQYVDDARPFLAALSRCVRPGGHLILSWPNRDSLFRRAHYRLYNVSQTQNDHSRGDIEAVLAELGFSRQAGRGHSFALPAVPLPFSPLNLMVNGLLESVFRLTGNRWIEDRLGYSHIALYRKVD